MWKQKNKVNKMAKLHSVHLEFIITIYHTYLLLYCKGYIQMTSNDSTINVEGNNNRVNKMTKLHSIHLECILQYITLTSYYIVKDKLR